MANIILIGMMGSGKSTLSHQLYKKTGSHIIDTDDIIEKDSGMSIGDIFDLYGENHFRGLETSLLRNLSCDQSIISTGGGMVLSEVNRGFLKSLGHVFYLSGSVETLYNRLISQTENRPLLDPVALQTQLSGLLLKRELLYKDAADYIISIDSKSAEEIVSEIYAILRELDYNFLT